MHLPLSLVLALAAGCRHPPDEGADGGSTGPDGGAPDGGDPDGGTTDGGGSAPLVLSGEASVEPNPDNPFGAIVQVELDHAATVNVRYGQSALTHSTPERELRAGETARIPVLGLVADTDWQLQVEARQGSSTWTSELLTHRTDPLPTGFPVCFPRFSAPRADFDPDEVICTQSVTSLGEYLYFCTNHDGEPVHMMRSRGNDSMMSMRPLSSGGWASTSFTRSQVLLFDELGAQTTSLAPAWFSSKTRFSHEFIDSHEMIELRHGAWAGALAFLTASVEWFADGSYKLGNGVVVWDPATGEVLYDYSFHGALGDGEAMDPAVPYSSAGRGDYAEDWNHANTLLHGADADGREYLLVSLKSQDWIVKLYPDTDELAWRLGPLGDFTLVDDLDAATPQRLGNLDWFYHQHGAVFVDAGDARLRLLMFDNGYPRHDGRQYRYDLGYSRLLQVEVDEDARRADLDWAYGSDDTSDPSWFFSSTCGNTILLRGEDRVMAMDGEAATIFEVSYPEGEERWRMSCDRREWCTYRVAWFPSIYERTWDRE